MDIAPERRFRYAPTPSHDLHVGNALSAIVGWASARAVGGTFILRIEDIDRQRCKPGVEERCLRDLEWLGIDWDEGPESPGPHGPYRQSERFEWYDRTLRDLQSLTHVYRCVCSRSDLARHTRAPHATQGTETPYPGTCRSLNLDATSDLERGGFRLDLGSLTGSTSVNWNDGFLGPRAEDVRCTCGDFLLGRWGCPTYQLAVVVDDISMGVTDVVRGRDLVSSTGRQILLHRALGHAEPRFAHHPLLTDEEGKKLSKRQHSFSIAGVRDSGFSTYRFIASLMACIGLLPKGVSTLRSKDCIELLQESSTWQDGQWDASLL
jgi:glutamyl-tRNA synthetase